jgi:phosphate transport system substrate-binding protein
MAQRHNTVGLTVSVAKEALSVYVHPENPVKNFSLAELKAIFTGETRNWRLLGGVEAPIFVLTRSSNSGTYLYFQKHILNEEPYLSPARVLPTTQAVVDMVAQNQYAIGYGGVAHGGHLYCSIEGIPPTHENIIAGKYPITRYLYLVTTGTPKGAVKEFIDWVLGPAGQLSAAEAGYVPLWSPTMQAE